MICLVDVVASSAENIITCKKNYDQSHTSQKKRYTSIIKHIKKCEKMYFSSPRSNLKLKTSFVVYASCAERLFGFTALTFDSILTKIQNNAYATIFGTKVFLL